MIAQPCMALIARRGLSSPLHRGAIACAAGVFPQSSLPRWNSSVTLENSLHKSEKTTLVIPDFSDGAAAYRTKSTAQLLRAISVFQACRWQMLVDRSEDILKYSQKILGGTLLDAILKKTLFGHFCAGEDEGQIGPVLAELEKAGIGSILDYAAEDDGSEAQDKSKKDMIVESAEPNTRVYDYESEQKCDRHVKTFKQCIQAVKNLNADGYAAVKVTALGNPLLLDRMSRALREVKSLYSKFDLDNDGYISRKEFENGYHLFFQDSEHDLEELFHLLDPDHTGQVDFITWSKMITPRDLPRITSKCREIGPLAMTTPTEEEVELMEAMFQRGHELAKEAAKCGTRILIDAEQDRFQPAIDNLVLDLQMQYNNADETDTPVIYNTYQCYLKAATEKMHVDIERSNRFNFHFGAKLVRGAYMEAERALAESLGYPSPIHETAEETHKCYDEAVAYLLRESVKPGSTRKIELMLASHNQQSIESAISVMDECGVDPRDSTICFAQLYGMADNLSFNLGKHGYRAYKYVPYGKVSEVIPYLVRRARENSSISGGAVKELSMITTELKRRGGFA